MSRIIHPSRQGSLTKKRSSVNRLASIESIKEKRISIVTNREQAKEVKAGDWNKTFYAVLYSPKSAKMSL